MRYDISDIDLTHEHKTRCPKIKDLTGCKYGMLTVVSYHGKTDRKSSLWFCSCDCGGVAIVEARLLPSRKSCGCLRDSNLFNSNRVRTHGRSESRIYSIWSGMKNRATNPNYERTEDYLGRGVGVCERWLTFENFYEDMGDPPTDDHTLERIDNNQGYSKENCMWQTRSRQQSNRRSSTNTSGRVGVCFCKQTGKWKVRLNCDKETTWLGRYDTYEEACDVIERAEIEKLGYSRKEEGFIK